MAQEIYRRKKPVESGQSQDAGGPAPDYPLGKIPPPPQLPKDLVSPAEVQTPSSQETVVPQSVPTDSLPLPTTSTTTAEPSVDSSLERLTDQQWQQQIEELVETITVNDGKFEYEFRCVTPMERMRVETLSVKEEGTVRWIEAELRQGDVFYDIGANIGVYSLMAAQRVGNAGTVYAFEPHVNNVTTLLGNVAANGMGPRLKVISTPLSDVDGFEEFHYFVRESGSSMSQFGERRDAMEQPFDPCFSEWKLGASIDTLVANGAIRAADMIKMDVDGNELKVLRGMRELLTGSQPPRSVQVEVHQRGRAEILELMQSYGYQLADRHYTAMGKQQLAAGENADSIAFLAIFHR